MPIATGFTGPVLLSDGQGSQTGFRQGRGGDVIVSELHGRYYEQAVRNNLFFAYAAAQTLSVVGTAMTGLILWNGNPKVNLVLQKVAAQVTVTSATMTGIALASTAAGAQTTTPSTATAATRSGSTLLGGTNPSATALTVGTTVTTTAFFPLLHNTAAIATTGVDAVVWDLEGSIIVPPNTVICLAALGAASAASAVTASMLWEEVPV